MESRKKKGNLQYFIIYAPNEAECIVYWSVSAQSGTICGLPIRDKIQAVSSNWPSDAIYPVDQSELEEKM